jgi:ribosomal protein L34
MRTGSAPLFGDVEGGAHDCPDLLGINTRLQGFVHRSSTKIGEHVVMSQRSRPDRAELLVHSLPEMGNPHSSRLGTRP